MEEILEQKTRLGYEAARRIIKSNSQTFYLASLFLPKRMRQAAYVIYAICKYSDDSVDEGRGDPREKLGRVRKEIDLAYDLDREPQEELTIAFRQTVYRYAIPKEYFDELIEGMRMDLEKDRYADFSELYTYCYRVAGVVGLIVLKLLGCDDPDAKAHAVELGIALQLTNILRDIKEDWLRGRIYLPLEEMSRFGVGEGHLEQGIVDEAFRRLLVMQIGRARAYYAASIPGTALIPRARSRFVVRAMRAMYGRILNEIERSGFDVFGRRARVSAWAKIRTCLGALFGG